MQYDEIMKKKQGIKMNIMVSIVTPWVEDAQITS